MYKEKDWEEFRESGMLWFINGILMMFGWALLYEHDDSDYIKVTPVRTSYRGFSPEINAQGYEDVTKYLYDNVDILLKDVNGDVEE